MSYSKFKVGDLVRHKSNHVYWKNKLGLVLSIEYTHGDAKYIVKWTGGSKPRRYVKSGLVRA